MTAVSPARLVAAAVLYRVENDPYAQAASCLLDEVAARRLRDDDARLARTIVFGVLRNGPTLDYYYAPLLNKKQSALQPELRLCLRMAACQHFLLSKIPPYAIVNETVSLARTFFKMKAPQVGFLNAVLRKLVALDEPPELPAGNRTADLTTRFGMPDFLVRLLVSKYGMHKATAIMQASLDEAAITLRPNTLKTSSEALADELARQGFITEPNALYKDALDLVETPEGSSLFDLPQFSAGHFYVQDVASQLVALIVSPQAGEKILDMCAAPGGKTTHMAELAGGAADIIATDVSPDRLKLVDENVRRLQTPGIRIAAMDEVLSEDAKYDVVLVDAPCSGTGTVRRNPEIKYRINADTLERQSERQLEVLEKAAACTSAQGRIIYSTCSFSNEENQNVIRRFLKLHPDWSINDKNEVLSELRAPDGFYRTWPNHPEMDGFEAVVLTRKG